ncbi:MAG: GTP-binding protein [Candidatus Heimdallarchaeota archaeon]|nr:GTP-binding protein [Candidatus Heimdallarchaeota archaeon]MCK5144309.1 GTP-binding protein [Candidatus Heimdallarchaeota archaeon]
MNSKVEVKFRDYDIYKLAICGPGRSGKTTICKRITENIFLKHYKPTVGAEFHTYSFKTGKGKAVALFYDMAGQKRFGVVRNLLYSGTNAAAIIFDVSRRESFKECANWIRELRNQNLDLDITIVGNKTDAKREVLRVDAERISRKLGCRYLETSALTGAGIGELVKALLGNAIKNETLKRAGR